MQNKGTEQLNNNQVIDKLKDMCRTVQDTKTLVNNTNVNLQAQGQKLININNLSNQIDGNLQRGNYIADGMMSLWTRIKHKLTGGFKMKSDPPLPTFTNQSQPNQSQKQTTKNPIQNEGQKTEEDQYLDYLANQLDDVKTSMKRTGATFDEHDKILESINNKTDKNLKNISQYNKKARYLVHK